MGTRRGESALTTLIALAILGVALYMVFPSWFSWLPLPSNAVKAEIIVNYADGTSKVFQGSSISQAVAQTGSTTAISTIVFAVKATPSWQGTTPSSVGSVVWTGSGVIKVDGTQKQTISLLSGLPSTVTNGQTVTVCTTTVSGSTLNGWIADDQASHTLAFNLDVGMGFTPPGDTAKSVAGTCTANLSLKNIGFPAVLTVQVTTTVS